MLVLISTANYSAQRKSSTELCNIIGCMYMCVKMNSFNNKRQAYMCKSSFRWNFKTPFFLIKAVPLIIVDFFLMQMPRDSNLINFLQIYRYSEKGETCSCSLGC